MIDGLGYLLKGVSAVCLSHNFSLSRGKIGFVRVTVRVKPGSKKGPLVETGDDGSLTVFLQQRAVDGAANDGLIEVLAKHYGVSKSRITIEAGFTSRIKRISVDT
jgi:uncharacterized protein YggU (UPF0235/DUF167 family)